MLFTFSAANSDEENSGDEKEKRGQDRKNIDKLNNFISWKIFAIITILGLKYKYPAAL